MYGDRQNICQVLQKSDHRKEKAMEIRKNSGPLKWILIGISTLFLIVMLILPLTYVLVTAFGEGIKVFVASVTDYYALKAIGLTLEVTLIAVVVNTIFGIAASWCITRFQFHGKKILSTLIDLPLTISPVIAGLIYILTFGRQSILYEYLRSAGIKMIFAVPGIVVATVFVTFPFISREIIPVLSTLGTDEEEAAALMGANGFTIFRKITLPQMKWGLIYGIILCTARALGEFGAVNALSKTRGQTFTLPLEIDALYMSGTDTSITSAFAVSSILVIIAVIVLILRNIFEYRSKNSKGIQ